MAEPLDGLQGDVDELLDELIAASGALRQAIRRADLSLERRVALAGDSSSLGLLAEKGVGLTAAERMAVALRATPTGRAGTAIYAPGLDSGQRCQLAESLGEEDRGDVALQAPDLSVDQRIRLVRGSTPSMRGALALSEYPLDPTQRFDLLMASTPEDRAQGVADPQFSASQRLAMARKVGPKQRRELAASCALFTAEERVDLFMTLDPDTRGWGAWFVADLGDDLRTRLALAAPVAWRQRVVERYPRLARRFEPRRRARTGGGARR